MDSSSLRKAKLSWSVQSPKVVARAFRTLDDAILEAYANVDEFAEADDLHPAVKSMLALGEGAIPFLLGQLKTAKTSPSFRAYTPIWTFLLSEITREHAPSSTPSTQNNDGEYHNLNDVDMFDQDIDWWLSWGERTGYKARCIP
jgi:hypothetical protein